MRFVDSNVFVYHLAKDPRHGKVATAILKRIEEGEEAATSTLVIAQVCGYLKWKRRSDAIPAFLALLRSLPSLVKVETLYDDFLAAERLCEERELPWSLWDDAVIAAQMERLGLSEIYSNDTDFDHIPGVRRVFE
jgi:predicted nucleic acid-binding protein